MSATLTTKDVRKGEFEAVRKGEFGVKDYEKPSAERNSHQAGVLEAVTDYCGQRTGHSRGRRGCRCILGKGCLQKYQRRRHRKGCLRQAKDKQTVKVALLTPEVIKRTDIESVMPNLGNKR